MDKVKKSECNFHRYSMDQGLDWNHPHLPAPSELLYCAFKTRHIHVIAIAIDIFFILKIF